MTGCCCHKVTPLETQCVFELDAGAFCVVIQCLKDADTMNFKTLILSIAQI